MRVLIEILEAGGRGGKKHLVEKAEARIGPAGSGADVEVPGLEGTIRIAGSGRVARLEYGQFDARLEEGHTIDFGLDGVKLRFSLLPGGVVGGRGACPRCGGSLRQALQGGAYRSVARDLKSCGRCGVQVVELRDAGHALGQFSDVTESDWFFVAAPHRCPTCAQLLKRARFRTAKGEAQVERCVACHLVVLDPGDLDALV